MSQMTMVAGGVLVAVVCSVVGRKQAPEIALVLTICAATAVALSVSRELGEVVAYVERLTQMAGISRELIVPVMKATGIAILSKFIGEFCRDAKEGGLASVVELAGTVLGLVAVMPLMGPVLELLESLMS